jgi:hypothetical protein
MNGDEFMATDKTTLIDQAAFEKASDQGQRLVARGPLALSAKYKAGRIHVELDNGCAFEFPAAQAEGLASATAADLGHIEIEAAGLSLHWPALDADLYVPNLVKGVLGSKVWMAKIGAMGGRAATPAKTEAARANGRLGGRPRKRQEATAI